MSGGNPRPSNFGSVYRYRISIKETWNPLNQKGFMSKVEPMFPFKVDRKEELRVNCTPLCSAQVETQVFDKLQVPVV